ncbi:ANTAR domain-containing protein [Rhodococcus sp. X156]|uniref:ANTAR domain-containing protein n=1 Tax=Rhodococcus sp. X156 TaxID=2499145 RepID=UPI000FDCBB8D|nr:ANTAR domain-containing protein [Rhodococcus sp. X156]
MNYIAQLGDELQIEAENLRQLLQERPSVDMAVGMLMSLFGYDRDQALAALRDVSQRHQVRQSRLAVALVRMVCNPNPLSPDHPHDEAAMVVRLNWGEALNLPARPLWRLTLGVG